MTGTEQAYSTSDPKVVAAYRANEQEYNDMAQRTKEDAKELGNNKGALIVKGIIGGPRMVGLEADDPASPPQGWQYIKSRGQLEPRRGVAGEAARQWVKDHQPPDLRAVLATYGLPTFYRRGHVLGAPGLFEHDGTVWALFQGVPQGECTWEARKLSEFYAAVEASDAAEQASQVRA